MWFYWFYGELERVLGHRPAFCPGEGDMLDSCESEESLNFTMNADATVQSLKWTTVGAHAQDGLKME